MALTEFDLTPTEDLILEILVARHRLGEPFWPIKANSTTTRAIQRLSDSGLVEYRSGPSAGYTQTSLTDEGRKMYASSTYKAPNPPKMIPMATETNIQKWCPFCGGTWRE